MRTQQGHGKYRLKVIAVWIALLLGMLFHIPPQFQRLSVVHSFAHHDGQLNHILGLGVLGRMMVAFIAQGWIHGQRYKTLHFSLTFPYTVMNGCQLIFDAWVGEASYRLCLMAYLLNIGLLPNFMADQWFCSEAKKQWVLRSVH